MTLRQWMLLFALAVLLIGWSLMLAACQTTGSAATEVSAPAACRAFEPIRWSVTDSIPTQKQAIAHNAAWKTLCDKPLPPCSDWTRSWAGTPKAVACKDETHGG